MNATIEHTEHLTDGERIAVRVLAKTVAQQCTTLSQARPWLACLSGWFIYDSGTHLALHKASGTARVLLVTEDV